MKFRELFCYIKREFRFSKFGEFLWWVKWRFNPKHQYNKLNTGLPPGYYDDDVRILYGVMNTFKTWYECNDHSFFQRTIDWDTNEEVQSALNSSDVNNPSKVWFANGLDAKKEFDIIYDWWVHRYLKTYKDSNMFFKIAFSKWTPEIHQQYNEFCKIEELLEVEADEMLARLMKYRRIMWS